LMALKEARKRNSRSAPVPAPHSCYCTDGRPPTWHRRRKGRRRAAALAVGRPPALGSTSWRRTGTRGTLWALTLEASSAPNRKNSGTGALLVRGVVPAGRARYLARRARTLQAETARVARKVLPGAKSARRLSSAFARCGASSTSRL
jgi:hypothetical protein